MFLWCNNDNHKMIMIKCFHKEIILNLYTCNDRNNTIRQTCKSTAIIRNYKISNFPQELVYQ